MHLCFLISIEHVSVLSHRVSVSRPDTDEA